MEIKGIIYIIMTLDKINFQSKSQFQSTLFPQILPLNIYNNKTLIYWKLLFVMIVVCLLFYCLLLLIGFWIKRKKVSLEDFLSLNYPTFFFS